MGVNSLSKLAFNELSAFSTLQIPRFKTPNGAKISSYLFKNCIENSSGKTSFSLKAKKFSKGSGLKLGQISMIIAGVACFFFAFVIGAKNKYLGMGLAALGFSLFATGISLIYQEPESSEKKANNQLSKKINSRKKTKIYHAKIVEKVGNDKEIDVKKAAKHLNQDVRTTEEYLNDLVKIGKLKRVQHEDKITYILPEESNPFLQKVKLLAKPIEIHFSSKPFTFQEVQDKFPRVNGVDKNGFKDILNYLRSRHKISFDPSSNTYSFLTEKERLSKKTGIVEVIDCLETKTDLEKEIQKNHTWRKFARNGNCLGNAPEESNIYSIKKFLEKIPHDQDTEYLRLLILLAPFIEDLSIAKEEKEDFLKEIQIDPQLKKLLYKYPFLKENILSGDFEAPHGVKKEVGEIFPYYVDYIRLTLKGENVKNFLEVCRLMSQGSKLIHKGTEKPNKSTES